MCGALAVDGLAHRFTVPVRQRPGSIQCATRHDGEGHHRHEPVYGEEFAPDPTLAAYEDAVPQDAAYDGDASTHKRNARIKGEESLVRVRLLESHLMEREQDGRDRGYGEAEDRLHPHQNG